MECWFNSIVTRTQLCLVLKPTSVWITRMHAAPLYPEQIQSLLTLRQIAAKLQRNPSSIWTAVNALTAVKRLNIQPVLTLPVGGSRYDPSVVDVLAARMRRPNHSSRNSN